MVKFKNTLGKGSVRYIVFKEQDIWYAAALEFNIVESGNDPREVLLSLFEAIQGYIDSARKIKARSHILNQKVDPEYEQLWHSLKYGQLAESQPVVYTFGERALVTV